MGSSKYEIRRDGPATVTLPDPMHWPTTKLGEPMEIYITNTGNEPLTVVQTTTQTLIKRDDSQTFKKPPVA